MAKGDKIKARRRTRLRIRDITGKTRRAKHRLMKIYGYMAVGGDPCRLVRPCASERAVDEGYYARKYGLRFTDRTVYEEADKTLDGKHDDYGNEKEN